MSESATKCPACGQYKPVQAVDRYRFHRIYSGESIGDIPELRRQRCAIVAARIKATAADFDNTRYWHPPTSNDDAGAPSDIAGHAFAASMAASNAQLLPGNRETGKRYIYRPVYRLPDGRIRHAVDIAIMLDAADYMVVPMSNTGLVESIFMDDDPANNDPEVAIAMLRHYGDTGVCDWQLARAVAGQRP